MKIALWPDYEYCPIDEIEEMVFNKSDDYTVIEIPDNVDIDDHMEFLIASCRYEGSIWKTDPDEAEFFQEAHNEL